MAKVVPGSNVSISPKLRIYLLENSARWQCAYSVQDGEWHRKTTGETSQQSAEEAAQRILIEEQIKAKHGITNVGKNSRKFARIAQLVLDEMESSKELGEYKQSYYDYKTALKKYLIPVLGNCDIARIGDADLERVQQRRIELNEGRLPSESTLLNHNAALRRVFYKAVKLNYITKDQIPDIEFSGVASSQRGSFTEQEIARILEFDEWWKNGRTRRTRELKLLLWYMARFLFSTGIRPGVEVLSLKWSQFDVAESTSGETTYKYAYVTEGKTIRRGRPRQVWLCKIASDALAEWRFASSEVDSDIVFVLGDCTRPKSNSLSKLFSERVVSLGLERDHFGDKRTLYSTRHTWITTLLSRGVPTAWVANLMGTSEKMIREYYSHVDIKDVALNLEELVEGKSLDDAINERIFKSFSPIRTGFNPYDRSQEIDLKITKIDDPYEGLNRPLIELLREEQKE